MTATAEVRALSVDAVLRRGHLWLSAPTGALLLIPFLWVLWVGPPFTFGAFAGAMAGGLALAVAYRAFAQPRWRLWAYRHVDDLGTLRQSAVRDGLAWPDDHIFTRGEVLGADAKILLRRLELDYLSAHRRWPKLEPRVETPSQQAAGYLIVMTPLASLAVWMGWEDKLAGTLELKQSVVLLVLGIDGVLFPAILARTGARPAFLAAPLPHIYFLLAVCALLLVDYAELGTRGWMVAITVLGLNALRGFLRGSRDGSVAA